jgi:hypothetical protein
MSKQRLELLWKWGSYKQNYQLSIKQGTQRRRDVAFLTTGIITWKTDAQRVHWLIALQKAGAAN